MKLLLSDIAGTILSCYVSFRNYFEKQRKYLAYFKWKNTGYQIIYTLITCNNATNKWSAWGKGQKKSQQHCGFLLYYDFTNRLLHLCFINLLLLYVYVKSNIFYLLNACYILRAWYMISFIFTYNTIQFCNFTILKSIWEICQSPCSFYYTRGS